jgi:cold shock protein
VLTARRRGTVKWYDARKGYGFIRDEGCREVFVHRSALSQAAAATPGALHPGQGVEYELEQNEKGLVAREVSILSD